MSVRMLDKHDKQRMFASKSLAVGFKALNLSTKSGECPDRQRRLLLAMSATPCHGLPTTSRLGGSWRCWLSGFSLHLHHVPVTVDPAGQWKSLEGLELRCCQGGFWDNGMGLQSWRPCFITLFLQRPTCFLLFSRSSPWSQVPRHLVLFGASERLQPLRKTPSVDGLTLLHRWWAHPSDDTCSDSWRWDPKRKHFLWEASGCWRMFKRKKLKKLDILMETNTTGSIDQVEMNLLT